MQFRSRNPDLPGIVASLVVALYFGCCLLFLKMILQQFVLLLLQLQQLIVLGLGAVVVRPQQLQQLNSPPRIMTSGVHLFAAVLAVLAVCLLCSVPTCAKCATLTWPRF